jgi:hypothetical protein
MSKWHLRPGNAELQLGKTETHAKLEPGAPRKGAPLASPLVSILSGPKVSEAVSIAQRIPTAICGSLY